MLTVTSANKKLQLDFFYKEGKRKKRTKFSVFARIAKFIPRQSWNPCPLGLELYVIPLIGVRAPFLPLPPFHPQLLLSAIETLDLSVGSKAHNQDKDYPRETYRSQETIINYVSFGECSWNLLGIQHNA